MALAVPKIPLMDYVGRPLLASVFLALLWLQWRFPLRRQHFSVLRRLVRNFVLSIPGFAVVRLAMLPIPIAVAMWAQQRHIGLLNWIAVPGWVAVIGTFLTMDYAYWWWHWANHMVPIFWRFHNVHHTDLDLDVSTAARFHFGEMIFSIGFLSLAVVVFGISPIMLIVFFITFEAATLFHHSKFIIPSCSARPILTGARFFAGGINSIARCDETCLRMPSSSVLLRIGRNMSSHWGNSLRCRFISNARGGYRTARSPNASQNQRKSSPSSSALPL